MASRLVVFVGASMLAHAAYSVSEYKLYLKTEELVREGLPIDIVAECFLGLLAVLVGILMGLDNLRPIDLTTRSWGKTINAWNAHPSFRVYNHRNTGQR